MFLYCVQFKNRNDLVKIGISKCPNRRMLGLSKVHGEVVKYKLYHGEMYKNAERILHKKLKDYKYVGQHPVDPVALIIATLMPWNSEPFMCSVLVSYNVAAVITED